MTSITDGVSPQSMASVVPSHYGVTANGSSNSANNDVAAVPNILSTKHCGQTISGRTTWNIKSSKLAKRTINRIRGIVESLKLTPNPSKPMIPLSIGENTLFISFFLLHTNKLITRETPLR